MGVINNFFENRFGKLNVNKKDNGYELKINYKVLGRRIDKCQDVLDLAVWNDMKKYMPIDSGTLIARTEALNLKSRGEVYLYDPSLSYSHYQYEGVIYEDPIYHVGGFTDGKGNWWSRKGVKKVNSGRPLFYKNPLAEAHWDEVAIQNHKTDWINACRKVLK